MILQITETLKTTYFIKGFDNYAFCDDKNLYNLKRGKKVKKTYNNGCFGFNLNSKFYSLKKIKLLLYKKDIDCPF
jgi:hypothetical protein